MSKTKDVVIDDLNNRKEIRMNNQDFIHIQVEYPFSNDIAWDFRCSIVRNGGYEIFEISIEEVRGIIVCLQQALDANKEELQMKPIEIFSHQNVSVLAEYICSDQNIVEVYYQIARNGLYEMQRITTANAKDIIIALNHAIKLFEEKGNPMNPNDDFFDKNVYVQAEYFCSNKSTTDVRFCLYIKRGYEITDITTDEALEIIASLQHAISINEKGAPHE